MSPLDEEYRRAIDELEKYIRPQIEENSRQLDRALTGFSLPIRINEHDEYDERLSFELERYLQSIKNTPALMRVPGFLDAVQEIVKKILFALKAERRGDTGDALKSIKSILVKYMEDDFFVSDLDSSYAFRGSAPFDNFKYPNYDYTTQLKYPLSFFRCRRNMQIMSRKEMLHVPLTKRSLISSNRFSLPGIPCLYIASTTYCCWKELEEPSDIESLVEQIYKMSHCLVVAFADEITENMHMDDLYIVEQDKVDAADVESLFYEIENKTGKLYPLEELKTIMEKCIREQYAQRTFDLIHTITHTSSE